MDFELNNQQKEAMRLGKKWYKNRNSQTFEISGCAGSGKSTIVSVLIDEMKLKQDEVLYVAYMGKAALALSRKGCFAKTIHSTIYDIDNEPRLDENGHVVVKNGRVMKNILFKLKDSLPGRIKMIVVDEAGTVSEDIARDILSFGLPVIALGDRNQLDPVFGKPYFLAQPDVVLTEPMRQALDSPIVYLSQRALAGKYIKTGKYGDTCFVITKDMITDPMLTYSDVVICAFNKTRDKLNKHIREEVLNIHKDIPIIGDKIICRQNNWKEKIDNDIYLINGTVGYVDNVYLNSYNGRSINIDFRPDFITDDYFHNIALDYKHLQSTSEARKESGRSYYNKFEYAYAVTTHITQGSEYDKCFIYNEPYGTSELKRKMLYTAITRARKSIILAL